ncbi:MAG: DnaJ family molecular chaperone [Rhizobiaceae bacterium]|nr:DnaJ family molecular chaperone [Rhizobiaceae bacterium]
MSIWSQLSEILSEFVSDAFTAVIEVVRTAFEGDPETRRQVGFSIAMIALSAKMAKSDGIVTNEEIIAFEEIFDIPEKEHNNVSRLYNLAKQDVAGYQAYAARIKTLFPDDGDILREVIHGLFHIAKADGIYHQNEMAFMDNVAGIFDIKGRDYERVKLRHMEPEGGNPYVLLEADREWGDDILKRHYRKLVAENHPDKLIARGVPPEFVSIANRRLAEINRAWEMIKLERSL